MTTVTLKYYAQLREQAGGSSEKVVTSATSLRELYDELRHRHGFTLPADALKVAVDDRFSDWSHVLCEGDTIVFIPPVAGG
ncbi:MoaD/ThiS family protein [Dyella sp.]|uniref:MoaD/ThiS family protein n=1 Tax=Dyella sp. TaxID=1869338 RepID=UPI002ED60115